MEELLTQIIQAIVDKPDEVEIKTIETENQKIYELCQESGTLNVSEMLDILIGEEWSDNVSNIFIEHIMLSNFKSFCKTYRIYLIGSLVFIAMLTGILLLLLFLGSDFTFIYE